MGKRKQKFNGQEFEILEHEAIPAFKTAFYIILCIAVVYFIYIFSQSSGAL
jgi:hypothetical protein